MRAISEVLSQQMLKRESDFLQGNVDLTSIRKQEIVERAPTCEYRFNKLWIRTRQGGVSLRFTAKNISLREMFFLFLLF